MENNQLQPEHPPPQLLGKRVKDDHALKIPPSGLCTTSREEDKLSMNNNTDLNHLWGKKKVKKVHFEGSEYTLLKKNQHQIEVANSEIGIDAHQFYEQSLYFVDTLQPEFCHVVGDNWLEFKEPVSIESIEPFSKTVNEGHWSTEEHCLFLEALKMYGKDWERIVDHVKTRDVKNIRAHSQKFLIRLVKMLEGGKALSGLSEEEAQYYYGILSKKTHRSAKAKLQKLEEQRKVEASKKIFHIEKVAGRSEMNFVRSKSRGSKGSPLKNQSIWMKSQAFSKKSLGFSIESRIVPMNSKGGSVKQTHCKFSFKSVVQHSLPIEDMSDGSDSADSYSFKNQFRFDIDSDFPPEMLEKFKGKFDEVTQLSRVFTDKMLKAIMKKGDIPEPGMRMVLQLGDDGPLVDPETGCSKKYLISSLHYFHSIDAQSKLPIMYQEQVDQLQEYMDGLDLEPEEEGDGFSDIEKYMYDLMSTPEGKEKIKTSPVHVWYMPKEEWEEKKKLSLAAGDEKVFISTEEALEKIPASAVQSQINQSKETA